MEEQERINDDRLLSIKEVCALLHIAENTFYRYVREKKIAVVRGVGRTKVRHSEVKRIIREGIREQDTK